MANVFLEKLRGARRIEYFIAIVILALLALQWMNTASVPVEGKSELETRLEDILERIDGTGKVSAMITQREDGSITGVLVVAEDMEDMQTYLNVHNAVKTLLDVELSQIRIIGRSQALGEEL